jgi:hypothetical protein
MHAWMNYSNKRLKTEAYYASVKEEDESMIASTKERWPHDQKIWLLSFILSIIDDS